MLFWNVVPEMVAFLPLLRSSADPPLAAEFAYSAEAPPNTEFVIVKVLFRASLLKKIAPPPFAVVLFLTNVHPSNVAAAFPMNTAPPFFKLSLPSKIQDLKVAFVWF